MATMINLKASRKAPTITVGCNPVTNVHIENPKEAPTTIRYPPVDAAGPQYPVPNSEFVSVAPNAVGSVSKFSDDPEKDKLMRENEVLKLIIQIIQSNPLVVNKYIVADDEGLKKMVGLLCNATEVHLDADDVGVGCISKNTYRKVHAIYVVVKGETLNLKYNFSDVMKTMKDLRISVKYVY